MIIIISITHEFDEKTYKPKSNLSNEDKKNIEKILQENFKEDVTYNRKENLLMVCNNQHLNHPAFLQILSKYRVFIMPSLFSEDFKESVW